MDKARGVYDSYAIGGVDLAETTDLCNATAQILPWDGKFLYLQSILYRPDVLERKLKKDKQDYFSMTCLPAENTVTSQLVIIMPGAYVQKEYVTKMVPDVCGIRF